MMLAPTEERQRSRHCVLRGPLGLIHRGQVIQGSEQISISFSSSCSEPIKFWRPYVVSTRPNCFNFSHFFNHPPKISSDEGSQSPPHVRSRTSRATHPGPMGEAKIEALKKRKLVAPTSLTAFKAIFRGNFPGVDGSGAAFRFLVLRKNWRVVR